MNDKLTILCSSFLTFPDLSSMGIKHFVWPVVQVVVPETDISVSIRFTPSFWSVVAVLFNVTRQKTLTSSKALGTKQNLGKYSDTVCYPVSNTECVITLNLRHTLHGILWPCKECWISIYWNITYQECENK